MASETFVSALLLVTGVVAAAILIVAVLPVIWGMVGTFGSASAATDRSMRTDFKIVTTYAKYYTGTNPPWAGVVTTVWMKNVGTNPIGYAEINSADVYLGKSDSFGRATLNNPNWTAVSRSLASSATIPWNFSIRDPPGSPNNGIWEPGETLEINAFYAYSPAWVTGQFVYFQFTLPNSVSRSIIYTAI